MGNRRLPVLRNPSNTGTHSKFRARRSKETAMHADAYYAIGSTHIDCQDYALAGLAAAGLPYAIVTDGCSSSPRSDVGARLLAIAAEQQLCSGNESPNPERIIARAGQLADALRLNSCLDATLLYAWSQHDCTEVVLSGDGVIATRRDDGLIEAWAVSFDDGAPAYLSYLLDQPRLTNYLARNATRQVEHWLDGERLARRSEPLLAHPYGFRLSLPIERYPLVMLLSDGAQSFHDERACRRLELNEVLPLLLSFKFLSGRFVVRRCRRFLRKQCPRRGWGNRDDIAAAAICTADAIRNGAGGSS